MKYSLVEEKYTEYNKPITLDDIKILRSIGRKSINDFTQEDIEKSQKWAYKFYQQLGTKSPFFRRWFGDWRAYDKKNKITVIDNSTKKVFKAGKSKNIDTGRTISWGDQIKGETKIKYGSESDVYGFLENIEEIVKNSIMFDTNVSELSSKHKMNNTAFMHSMYSIIEDNNGNHCLIKLLVEEAFNDKMTTDFSRAYELQEIRKVATLHTGVHSKNGGLTRQVTTIYSISELFDFVKQYDKDFKPHPVNEAFLNEDGTPKEFYHGSKKGGGFTEFKDWQYFTENQAYAKRYTERDNEKSLYRVFIKINKPFDTRNPECKKIFEQMKMEYGLSNLQENGLPDWTDGYDIAEFIEENQLDFDGIILDEGGDLIDGEHISRGLSYVVRNSKQIKSASDNIGTFDTNTDIRYSLPENPTPEQIGEALKNGEIDMDEYKRLINESFQQAVKNNGAIKPGEKPKPISDGRKVNISDREK